MPTSLSLSFDILDYLSFFLYDSKYMFALLLFVGFLCLRLLIKYIPHNVYLTKWATPS